MIMMKRAKNIKFDEFGSPRKKFDFQNLKREKSFVNIEITCVEFQARSFLFSLTILLLRYFKNRRLNDKNAIVNDLKLYDEYFINNSFRKEISKRFKKRDHESMSLIFPKTMLAQFE